MTRAVLMDALREVYDPCCADRGVDGLDDVPWLDEVLWQIVRFPNLYASIAATVNFISRQPRVFAEMLGKMMWWCGEDKIIYGGEAPIWHPRWALEELTDQAKRKILGGNLARPHGMEVPA